MLRIGLTFIAILMAFQGFSQTVITQSYPEIFEPDYENVYPQKDGSFLYYNDLEQAIMDCDSDFNDCTSYPTEFRLSYYLGLFKLENDAIGFEVSSFYYIYDPLKDEWFRISKFRSNLVDGEVYTTENNQLLKYDFGIGEFSIVLDENVRTIRSSPNRYFLSLTAGGPTKEYDKDWNFIKDTPGLYFSSDDSDIVAYAFDDAFWSSPAQYPLNVYELYLSLDGGENFELIKTLNGDELTDVFVFKNHVYFRYLSNAIITPFESTRPINRFGRINVNTLVEEEVLSNGLEPLVPVGEDLMQRRNSSIHKYVNGSFDEIEVINPTPPDEINSFEVTKIRTSKEGDLYAKSTELLYRYDKGSDDWIELLDGKLVIDFDVNDSGDIYFISDETIFRSVDDGLTYEFVSDYLVNPVMIKWISGNQWVARAFNSYYEPPSDIGLFCSDCWSHYPPLVFSTANNGGFWQERFVEYIPWSFEQTDIDYWINSDRFYQGTNQWYFYFLGNNCVSISNSISSYRDIDGADVNPRHWGVTKNDKIFTFSSGGAINYTESFNGGNWVDFDFEIEAVDVGQGVEEESLFVIGSEFGKRQLFYMENIDDGFNKFLVLDQDELSIPINDLEEVHAMIDDKVYLIHSDQTISKVVEVEQADNLVFGSIFLDENSNCEIENEEIDLNATIHFRMGNRQWTVVTSDGSYEIYLPKGTFDIEINVDSSLWSACPFPSQLTLDNEEMRELNIGLEANNSCEALELSLSSTMLFSDTGAIYFLHAKNIGNEATEEAVIELSLDSQLELNDINGNYTMINPNTFSIDLPSLLPGENATYEIQVELPVEDSVGKTYCIFAKISGAVDCDGNPVEQSLCQESINPQLNISQRSIFNEEGLTDVYFELDEWINVNLQYSNRFNQTADGFTISEEIFFPVDIFSVELISSSHPVEMFIEQPANLIFKSESSIPGMLEDSIRSQVVLNYRIKADANAVERDEWLSSANINFGIGNINSNTTEVIFRENCGSEETVEETNVELCTGENYNGHYLSGRYRIVHNSVDGCDSIEYANLTVNQSYYHNLGNFNVCPGEEVFGETEEGQYVDSLLTIDGCDSLIVFRVNHLFVSDDQELFFSLCEDNPFGILTDTLIIDTLTTFSDCEFYRFNYYDIKTEEDLNSIIDVSICNGESYEGLNESGTYPFSHISVDGCDSTHTINLFVVDQLEESFDTIICAGEIYDGYFETGIYQDQFTTASGCDSIFTLDLTVLEAIEESLEVNICEGEIFEGFTETGIYELNFTAVNGCDSLVVLDLEVLDEDHVDCIDVATDDLKTEELLSLYPNPANDQLWLAIDNEVILLNYTIGNLSAKEVMQGKFSTENSIDVSTLTSGLYFIRIELENNHMIHRKFIISN